MCTPSTEFVAAPVDPTTEAHFDGLSADELTMLLNRYEQLARSDLGRVTDDRSAIDLEIWCDITYGPVSQYIDITRTIVSESWIQLRSGDAICKPEDGQTWTRMYRGEFELPEPVVIVSIVSRSEPTGLRLAIDNSSPPDTRPGPELRTASERHF